jgi:hypothetical protein
MKTRTSRGIKRVALQEEVAAFTSASGKLVAEAQAALRGLVADWERSFKHAARGAPVVGTNMVATARELRSEATRMEVRRHHEAQAMLDTLDTALGEAKAAKVTAFTAFFRAAEAAQNQLHAKLLGIGAWGIAQRERSQASHLTSGMAGWGACLPPADRTPVHPMLALPSSAGSRGRAGGRGCRKGYAGA